MPVLSLISRNSPKQLGMVSPELLDCPSEVFAKVFELLLPIVGVLAELLIEIFNDPFDFVRVRRGVMIVVHTCHQDRTFDAPAVPLHGKVAKFVVEQEPQAGLVELARVRLIPPGQRATRRVSLGRLEDSVCYLFEIL